MSGIMKYALMKDGAHRAFDDLKGALKKRSPAEAARYLDFKKFVDKEDDVEVKETVRKMKRMVPGIDTDFSWMGALKNELRREVKKKTPGSTTYEVKNISKGDMGGAPDSLSVAARRRRQALRGGDE